jgi:translation elongation factor EF-G
MMVYHKQLKSPIPVEPRHQQFFDFAFCKRTPPIVITPIFVCDIEVRAEYVDFAAELAIFVDEFFKRRGFAPPFCHKY